MRYLLSDLMLVLAVAALFCNSHACAQTGYVSSFSELSPVSGSVSSVPAGSSQVSDGNTSVSRAWSSRSGRLSPVSHVSHTQTALAHAPVNAAPLKPVAPFIDLSDKEVPVAADASVSDATESMDMLIRLAVWTIIVLCLCTLTVLGIRRWQAQHGMLPLTRSNAQVLETISLGPHRSVSLVQLRHVQALVGCDASGIRSIVIAHASFEDAMNEIDQELSPAEGISE